jgi:N-acetylmuramoyl-L-alanine amidase CwlD
LIKKILLSLLVLIAATSAVEAAEQKTEPTFKERTANLAEIQSIRFGYGSGTIRIVVDITKNVEFKESYVENPSRIIIDLKNAWLNPKVQREFEFKSLAAKKLRIAQFDPTTVRIVIETMADTRPFFLSGGKAGHRFVVDVGNAEFKEDPELNKPDPKPTNPPPAPTNSNPSTPTVREIPTDIEIVDPEDEKLKEQQERELKEKREKELKEQQERELKEKQERELKEKQERELKEQQERELKEKREREIKEQRERELREQQERELKEKREKELKEQQERELKEQRKREKELKEQQERELKEKREREIKEQREREKQLEKERKEQEKRDKKEKEKKSKDKDEEKTVDKPFKDLEDDLDRLTNLRGRVIAIDPGHGGNDAGAIGPSGVMEKNVTLKVALELQRLLEAEGATVIMTRETDRTVSSKGAKASDIEELNARCEVANRAGAEIFISIHADSFTRPEARGTTGYYYSKSTTGRGQKLADCIRRNLIEQLGTPSRGTQPCNFYVVKNTDMPATLIELGFISNKEEEKLLDSKEGVMKAAQGIFDGIEDYFG